MELHRDRGLFLQNFGYFKEGLFNETPLKISGRTHSILAWSIRSECAWFNFQISRYIQKIYSRLRLSEPHKYIYKQVRVRPRTKKTFPIKSKSIKILCVCLYGNFIKHVFNSICIFSHIFFKFTQMMTNETLLEYVYMAFTSGA